MKSRLLISVFALVFSVLSIHAQYVIDRINAPANPIPFSYKAAHFGLKGDIKSEKLEGTFGYEYIFDKEGRVTKTKSDLLGDIDYFYDAMGNLLKSVSKTDYGDVTELYTVDNVGRVLQWSYSDGSGGSRYSYNEKGLWVASTAIQTGELLNKKYYDSQNRIIKEETYKNGVVSYSSDYKYSKVGDKLKVDKISTNKETGKETTLTDYYLNGVNLYSSSDAKLVFDEQGNWYQKVNATTGKTILQRVLTYHSGKTSGVVTSDTKPSTPSNPSNPSTPSKATGCVSGDCNNGWGRRDYNNGYYLGFWKNGFREGYGMYVWDEGGKYIGFWRNDKYDGYGCYLGTTKDFIGEYKEGSMSGLGYSRDIAANKWTYARYDKYIVQEEYTFYDNKIVEGCIAGDCQNKYGRYKWSNGDTYTGFFRNGNMYMGVYSFASGDKYEGFFNGSNQFHGQGRYFYTDNSYYGGEWVNGQQQGRGYYHDSNYKKQIGEWSQGSLVKSYE